jgi:hypothetical protein
MKHPSSRDLHAYWNTQRRKRTAPNRSDIEPGAIRHLLGDSFILALGDRWPFRLAGTRICALFGRELKDEHFTALWEPSSRPAVENILDILADESVGVVAGVTARNDAGAPIDLELLLLPLAARRPGQARAIGVLAPFHSPDWLGTSLVADLVLGSRRHIGATLDAPERPRFMTIPGRGRRGFVVYDGGRT